MKKPLDYHTKNIDVFYSLSENDVITLKRYVRGLSGRYEMIIDSSKIKFKNKMNNMDYIITLDDIVKYSCELYNINVETLKSRSAEGKLPDLRAFIYKLANSEFKYSKNSIGRFFGRNHASIINGINKITDIIDTEKSAREVYEALNRHVKNSANIVYDEANL